MAHGELIYSFLGSQRRILKKKHEEKVYSDQRKRLIKMFDDVFKENLTSSSRLDVPQHQPLC